MSLASEAWITPTRLRPSLPEGCRHGSYPSATVVQRCFTIFLLILFHTSSMLSTLLITCPSCNHTDVHQKCLCVMMRDADSVDGLTAWSGLTAWIRCMRSCKCLPICVSCIPRVCLSVSCKNMAEIFNLSVIEVKLPFDVQQGEHLPFIVSYGQNAA